MTLTAWAVLYNYNYKVFKWFVYYLELRKIYIFSSVCKKLLILKSIVGYLYSVFLIYEEVYFWIALPIF